jgi:hypothetical protein
MVYLIIDKNKFYKDRRGYYYSPSNGYLHRFLWEKFNNKKIPSGFHIHHVDGNKENNTIGNLVIVSKKKHLSQHYYGSIGEIMKSWHKSKNGKSWHKQRAVAFFAKRKKILKKCQHCGVKYWSKGTYSKNCNSKCAQLYCYYKKKEKNNVKKCI